MEVENEQGSSEFELHESCRITPLQVLPIWYGKDTFTTSLQCNELTEQGLVVAVLTIFIRSVFRVAELSGGFNGKLFNEEIPFMILEGPMVIIACTAVSIFHPGIAFQGSWHEADFIFWTKFRFGNGKILAGEEKHNVAMSDGESGMHNGVAEATEMPRRK